MAWPPDDRLLTSITSHITNALQEATVWFGRISGGEDSPVARAGDKIADALRRKQAAPEWATPDAISGFLIDQLNASLSKIPRKGGEFQRSLREVAGYEDLPEHARELANALTSLPWVYDVIVPTPLKVADSARFPDVDLGEGFALRIFDDETAATYVLPRPDEYTSAFFHQQYPTAIETRTVHLTRQVNGYLPEGDFSPEADYTVHSLKGAMGLLLVDGMLQGGRPRFGPPAAALPILTFRVLDNGERILLPLRWLTSEDTDVIYGLQLSNPEGDFTEQLHGPIAAFRDGRTRSSARWYLDSFGRSTGPIQRIVSATIAIEALLGDKKQAEKLGLTALLANRLAFLIGYSPTHRDDIIRQFERLYDLRSHIVHSGKAMLERSERNALTDLQQLTWYALKRQIGDLHLRSG